MKLGIILPLKSRLVSRDWDVVSSCLVATLRSLENQSCCHWRAVVVGHEKPDVAWHDYSNNISWVSSPHGLPPIRDGGHFTRHSDFDYILDKNRKTAIGMRHLLGQAITDWFVLDADDLMHRDFVQTLSSMPQQAGWLIKNGYLWYQDLKRWMPSGNMLNLCGSTAVINAGLFEVPHSDCDEDLKKIPWCRMSHSDMTTFLQPHLGGSDPTLPLPATAYTLSHGDNCSDEFRSSLKSRMKFWLRKRVFTYQMTPQFKDDFGIRV
jgi:hypothetical protein